MIMFAFTVWNWYLAFVGYSTIEFWGSMMQEAEPNKVKFEYGFKTVYDNLYKTFGTNKIFRVFSPSMRNHSQIKSLSLIPLNSKNFN